MWIYKAHNVNTQAESEAPKFLIFKQRQQQQQQQYNSNNKKILLYIPYVAISIAFCIL